MRPAGKRPSNHAGYSFFSVAVNNPVDGLPVWDCDTSQCNHETNPIFWLRLWSASCSMRGVATAPSSPTMPGDLIRSSEHLRGEGAEPIVSTAQPPSELSGVGLNPLVVRLPVELDIAVPVADSALGGVGTQLTQAISLARGANNATLNSSQLQSTSNQRYPRRTRRPREDGHRHPLYTWVEDPVCSHPFDSFGTRLVAIG